MWTLDTPQSYQVIQRDGSGANIPVRGTVHSGGGTVEARWNGGDWTAIGTASGDFSLTLDNQAQGQGTLDVRINGASQITREYVGVGDVFVIAGQSNAVGAGTNNQSYSHATLRGGLFANSYLYKNLTDPTDSNTGQVDTVSSDSLATMGSMWPLLATLFMADQSVPVMFIPCAKSSSSIADWQPGADHQDRSTLYGSMVYRALQQPNGVKAVLFHQGERDAQLNTAQATYNSNLDTLANAIMADLGVPLMPAKLQQLSVGYDPEGWYATINAAIADAWADNANVEAGADFSALGPFTDGVHFQTDAELQDGADGWWAALVAAFGY